MDTIAKDITFKSLLDQAGAYAETRIDLIKLKAIDKSSSLLSTIVSKIVLAVVAVFFVMILSIGLALWIGELMGRSYYGFFIVAGLYALTGLVLYSLRDQIIKRPISDGLIKKILN